MNKAILKHTQSNYNTIAPHFSKKRQYIWQDLKPFLKLIKKGDKVLDIGCGNARIYGALKEKDIDYLGIDFSNELIKIAKNKYPQTKFRVADITKNKTWNSLKNYDICFCIAVLHHLPARKLHLKVLKNINKSLKPNGLLILSVWNLWQKKFWPMHLKQIPYKISKGFKLKWLQVPYKVSDGKKVTQKVNRFHYAFCAHELKFLIKKSSFKLLNTSSYFNHNHNHNHNVNPIVNKNCPNLQDGRLVNLDILSPNLCLIGKKVVK